MKQLPGRRLKLYCTRKEGKCCNLFPRSLSAMGAAATASSCPPTAKTPASTHSSPSPLSPAKFRARVTWAFAGRGMDGASVGPGRQQGMATSPVVPVMASRARQTVVPAMAMRAEVLGMATVFRSWTVFGGSGSERAHERERERESERERERKK